MRIKKIFQRVAPTYDLMNDIMSFGLHRVWKRQFIKEISLEYGAQIVDIASGTLDIGLSLLKQYPHRDLQIYAIDPTYEMLQEGRKKSVNYGILDGIFLCQGDGCHLPLKSNSMDVYTISFGLRNILDQRKVLEEAFRVLRSGGTFYCMEFTPKPNPSFLDFPYQIYSKMIPHIGKYVAGDFASYEYLVESIAAFSTPEALAQLLREVGFEEAQFQHKGIIAIHNGQKP